MNIRKKEEYNGLYNTLLLLLLLLLLSSIINNICSSRSSGEALFCFVNYYFFTSMSWKK